jgi:uncharacterized damage-inducible protein DinB
MTGATMLPEFDHEMSTTRRLLERVDAGRFDWKPHDRSFSLGELAIHLAQVPGWAEVTLTTEELDVGQDFPAPEIEGTEDLLALFDEKVERARELLAEASGEDLMVPWSLVVDGEPTFTMPRAAVLRTWVLNHAIHHRGQLSVYLRLLDIPVPSMYGPSADEEDPA